MQRRTPHSPGAWVRFLGRHRASTGQEFFVSAQGLVVWVGCLGRFGRASRASVKLSSVQVLTYLPQRQTGELMPWFGYSLDIVRTCEERLRGKAVQSHASASLTSMQLWKAGNVHEDSGLRVCVGIRDRRNCRMALMYGRAHFLLGTLLHHLQ